MITLEQAINIYELNDNFTHKSFYTKNNTRVHVFNYGLASPSDFSEPFKGSGFSAYEMRGIVFVDYPEKVDTFPFLRKFFGINSTGITMEKVLRNKNIISCYEKLDGSLCGFVYIDGVIRVRTSNDIAVFEGDKDSSGQKDRRPSPVASMIQEYYEKDDKLKGFVKEALDAGFTPAFEYQSLENMIVVDVSEVSLKLIQMRDSQGKYVDIHNHELVKKYDIVCADSFEYSLDELLSLQKTQKNIEGWVVNFDGDLVKIKTAWYEDLHDLTFEKRITAKTILSSILNKNIDDVISSVGPEFPFYEIFVKAQEDVSKYISKEKASIIKFATENAESVKDSSVRKNFASTLGNNMHYLTFSIRYGNSPELEEKVDEYFQGFLKNEKASEKLINSASPGLNNEIKTKVEEVKQAKLEAKKEFYNN